MRLTADILLRAENYINAWQDRELCLRGLKIPAIENLAILQDQFDCLDISDNEIRKLNNFPAMRRLTTILANNNYISRIEKLGESLTGITSLILTNNRIANLSEIDNIATLNHLEHLSLIDNPVTLKSNYRLYVMHKIPSLKSLDFRKIQQKEKDAAKKYFKSVLGKAMLSDISAESSMNSNSENHPDGRGDVAYSSSHALSEVTPLVLTEEQKKIVREAIESATTKGEIDLIEKQLKSGTFFALIQEQRDGTDNSVISVSN